MLYERLHAMHVDGYVLSPHYPHQKLCREGSAKFHAKMHERFREVSERLSDYNLMISPIYLEYLARREGVGLQRVGRARVWAAGVGPVRAAC